MDRSLFRAIERMLQSLANRVKNMVVRGKVRLADDAKKQQRLQVDGFPGGPADDAEHFQAYGFSSIPLDGADAVIVFAGADRHHPLVVAVSDKRYRPTGGEPGEVTVYNHTGAKIKITKDGDVIVTPAAGREVQIKDAGAAGKLVPLSEFLNHTHASFGAAPTEIVPSVPPGFDGTKVLKAE